MISIKRKRRGILKNFYEIYPKTKKGEVGKGVLIGKIIQAHLKGSHRSFRFFLDFFKISLIL